MENSVKVLVEIQHFKKTMVFNNIFFLGRPYTVVMPGGGSGGTIVQPIPEGQVVTVPLQSSDSPVVQWQIHGTSDVSDFLRTMNKERMHLEQELGREEETAVHRLLKEQVMIKTILLLFTMKLVMLMMVVMMVRVIKMTIMTLMV